MLRVDDIRSAEALLPKQTRVFDGGRDVPRERLEQLNASRWERVDLRVLDIEDADEASADHQGDGELGPAPLITELVVGIEQDVRRVVRLPRDADLSDDPVDADPETVALAVMGAGPAVQNELVGGVVLQPHRGSAVTEGLADVRQDLFEEPVEVENRADSLGHALEKEQLLNPLLVIVVHRTVRRRADNFG